MLLWPQLGFHMIKVVGYLANRLFGQFLLDKTVDLKSHLQCTDADILHLHYLPTFALVIRINAFLRVLLLLTVDRKSPILRHPDGITASLSPCRSRRVCLGAGLGCAITWS